MELMEQQKHQNKYLKCFAKNMCLSDVLTLD